MKKFSITAAWNSSMPAVIVEAVDPRSAVTNLLRMTDDKRGIVHDAITRYGTTEVQIQNGWVLIVREINAAAPGLLAKPGETP